MVATDLKQRLASWAGISSQEEVSALVPRTGQTFRCSAAVLRKFSRTHFLFAGQILFAGRILEFDKEKKQSEFWLFEPVSGQKTPNC
jgi:hypothetical protein